MARRDVAIGEIVSTLSSFEDQPVTRDRVLHYFQETAVAPSSLQPYLHFREDGYTRNLVFRDQLFEVMLICWQPGQRTPVHTHNGQLGWMSVERGALAVVEYTWRGCNAPENQNVVGLDCLAGATELELERQQAQDCYPGGPVNTVDKQRTIHQVIVQGREPAVSLHVYSRPIDSCVAFDLERRRCYRRELAFHSRFGQVVTGEEPLATRVPSPLPRPAAR